MSTFETFTEKEILEVFAEICDEISYEIEDHDVFVSHRLTCTVGEIQFSCFLNHDEPLFEQLSLLAPRTVPGDPYKFCNNFNLRGGVTRAFVNEYDPDDEYDDPSFYDGPNVKARLFINFGTGVTLDYIMFMLFMWLEDLNDFFELEEQEKSISPDSEFEVEVEVPQSPEFLELSLVERIAVYLSLNSDRTAREMSKVLGFDRHEINSILYKHRDRFVKSGEQPPRWSIKSAVSS
jgi:hypothetical protein